MSKNTIATSGSTLRVAQVNKAVNSTCSTWGASRKVVFVAFCGYDESECKESEDQHEPDMMIVKGYREVEDNFSIKQALALWHAAKCDTGHIVRTYLKTA